MVKMISPFYSNDSGYKTGNTTGNLVLFCKQKSLKELFTYLQGFCTLQELLSAKKPKVYRFNISRVCYIDGPLYQGFQRYIEGPLYGGFATSRFRYIQGPFYRGFLVRTFAVKQPKCSLYRGSVISRVRYFEVPLYRGSVLSRVPCNDIRGKTTKMFVISRYSSFSFRNGVALHYPDHYKALTNCRKSTE